MSRIKTKNPFTLKTLKEYALDQEPLLKVQRSRDVQKKWASSSVEDRVSKLREALKYFTQEIDSIALMITEHVGKPLNQSKNEVNSMIDRAEFLFKSAPDELKDDLLPEQEGLYRKIVHEPHGVVFIISAWNYPLLITINGLMAALLSGNSVLLKHSSKTLGVGELFSQVFGTIKGFEDLVQDIVLDHAQTSEIIQKMPIDYVIFTGSVSGGKQINQDASHQLLQCQLELGGKDAAYVHKDANLHHAVESIVDGAMYNAGQSCCGVERVYVHEDYYDEFIERAKQLVESYVLGDPLNEATQMGPLADSNSAKYMSEQIDEAVKVGAKLLVGGKSKITQGALFFEPTLIVDVPQDSLLIQEENFGPILPVVKVKNEIEAIGYINDSNFGLSCSLFTQDQDLALRWSQDVEAGTVFMNCCDFLDPALAWTGYKNSGKGSGLSRYTFQFLTKLKSINLKKVK